MRNGAENGFSRQTRRVILIEIHRSRICTIEQVEEFKEAQDAHALVDTECFRDAQIHVHKPRGAKGIAGSFQVPAVKVTVTVLIEGHKAALRIGETALYAEKAAELDLPGKLHEPVSLEGVVQGEVGGTIVERGTVVKDARLRHVVAVAREESSSRIGFARASHRACLGVNGTGIGDHGRNTAEAVGGESITAPESVGAQVRSSCRPR